jgi:DNA replication protein DnaC
MNLLFECGIPKRFRGCTLIGFVGDAKGIVHARKLARKYVDEFTKRKEEGCSLVLCGSPGTGKTHLACAIGLELIRREHPVLYTTEYRATRAVKQTWNADSKWTETDILKDFYKPDLLILDEVGVSFGSDTEKMIFYQIINGRYERKLPAIVIGNLNQEELTAHVGERIMDRLRDGGGVVVAFDWESYRK